jgi:hypothetical protein
MFVLESGVAHGSALIRRSIYTNSQVVQGIPQGEQSNVRLQPRPKTRTEFQQIFGAKRYVGSAVECFDMRLFQPHHIEGQLVAAP